MVLISTCAPTAGDAGGLYQVGSFPHWGIWAEWNGRFRDDTRDFIRGTNARAGTFADVLCGSPRLYKQGGRQDLTVTLVHFSAQRKKHFLLWLWCGMSWVMVFSEKAPQNGYLRLS